jgi:hypothetical protein
VADDFAKNYHFVPAGDMFARPVRCRVVGTFSDSGATCTVDTTGRKSQVGVTITGASGDYDVAGLPRGSAYHVVGCQLLVPDGTDAVSYATVQADSLAPSDGTLTFQTRTVGTTAGAETAPADGTVVHLTLDIETGVY